MVVEFRRVSQDGADQGKGKGTPLKLFADTLITAIGQKVDAGSFKGVDTHADGRIRVDPVTGATSVEGIFAGGDGVTGPGWAIDAIAAGKRGAEAIHRYLS